MHDLREAGQRPPIIVIENVVGLLYGDSFNGLSPVKLLAALLTCSSVRLSWMLANFCPSHARACLLWLARKQVGMSQISEDSKAREGMDAAKPY